MFAGKQKREKVKPLVREYSSLKSIQITSHLMISFSYPTLQCLQNIIQEIQENEYVIF